MQIFSASQRATFAATSLLFAIALVFACADTYTPVEPIAEPTGPRLYDSGDSLTCAMYFEGRCGEPSAADTAAMDYHMEIMNKEGAECLGQYVKLYAARYYGGFKIIPERRLNGAYNHQGAYGVRDGWIYIREDLASVFENRWIYNHEAAHGRGHGLNQENATWMNNFFGTNYTAQPDQNATDKGNECMNAWQ